MRSTLLPIAAALSLLAGTAQVQAASYAIDPTHTFVSFEIAHFATSTNRGRFDKKEGSIEFDRAGKSGKVDLTVDITSINTGTPAFNKHLQSADLFNAEKFPTMKFVADKFSFNGDKVTEVTGALTLLGKTNPLTLKATNFNCYESPMLKREAVSYTHLDVYKRQPLHELSAWALLSLAALHVLAALKHQWIDRDGLLLRMMPKRVSA